MSRKYTLATDSTRPMPRAKQLCSNSSNATSGNHGRTMLPTMSSSVTATSISINEVKPTAPSLEITTMARGKYTLEISDPWPTTEPAAPLTVAEKKFHGTRPVKKYRA